MSVVRVEIIAYPLHGTTASCKWKTEDENILKEGVRQECTTLGCWGLSEKPKCIQQILEVIVMQPLRELSVINESNLVKFSKQPWNRASPKHVHQYRMQIYMMRMW